MILIIRNNMKFDLILIAKIIKFIFDLIAEGMSENAAISQAACTFGLQKSVIDKIWAKHRR